MQKDLITIEDETEQEYTSQLVTAYKEPMYAIGLNDIKEEGNYVWSRHVSSYNNAEERRNGGKFQCLGLSWIMIPNDLHFWQLKISILI